MLQYDINTVTAGDFTVEMDITKKMWIDFETNIWPTSFGKLTGYGKQFSKALFLKSYLTDEISRILTLYKEARLAEEQKVETSHGH